MLAKKALAEVDPDLVIYDIQPYSRVIQGTFDQQNMIASLTWPFGAVGLVLAAVGLYGDTSYGVEQRRSEIGVRMARAPIAAQWSPRCCAERSGRSASDWGSGFRRRLGAGYLMASQLFGVKPWNPLLLAGATMLLGLAALMRGSDSRAKGSHHRPHAGAAQRMIHTGDLQASPNLNC